MNDKRIIFLETTEVDIFSASGAQKVSAALRDALGKFLPASISGQGLAKVHIGEQRNASTRMRPEFVSPSVDSLRDRGMSRNRRGRHNRGL